MDSTTEEQRKKDMLKKQLLEDLEGEYKEHHDYLE